MGSITSYSKQVVVFFLALSLFIRPAFASSVGGWSMSNPVAQGASTIYEGSKNVIINGADYVKKGTAKITPTASNVAKTLGKGVAGVAVSVVIDQLLDGVDWVLDPANNQIRYSPPPEDPADPTYNYYYVINIKSESKKFTTGQNACDALRNTYTPAHFPQYNGSIPVITYRSSRSECVITGGALSGAAAAVVNKVANPLYDRDAEREQKTISLETVASQVISNAESETDSEKRLLLKLLLLLLLLTSLLKPKPIKLV